MSVRNILLNAAAPGFNFGANWANRRALSAEGDAWPATGTDVIRGVAYGAGKYVVYGRFGGKVATSSTLSSFDHITFVENGAIGYSAFTDPDLFVNLNMYNCIYAGGLFVGVVNFTNFPFWYSSDGLNWYVSDNDGDTWRTRDFNPGPSTKAPTVVHNGSIFLSVAAAGRCLTSATGITWADQPGLAAAIGTPFGPRGVVWTGTRFVAAFQETDFGTPYGESTIIVTSTNGVTWTLAAASVMTDIDGFSYFSGNLIAIARDSGSADRYVFYSADHGATWTRGAKAGFGGTGKITEAAGGMFWASSLSTGRYYYSSSVSGLSAQRLFASANFTESPYTTLNSSLRSMSYVNSKMLAGTSRGDLWEVPATSANPPTITNKYPTINLLSTRFTGVSGNNTAAANGTHIIFAGDYGRIARMTLENLPSSAARADLVSVALNGAANWGTAGEINIAVWDATRFIVAGDDGKVATSADGNTWVYQTGLRVSSWGTTDDVRCGVVVAGTTWLFGQSGKLASSSDGVTWSPSTGLSVTAWATTTVNGVAHSGALFVVVGDTGKVATSPDGVTWTNQTGLSSTSWSTTKVTAVAWSGDLSLFVAVGDTGKIATSPDGVTWTVRTSGTTQNLTGVVWGLDRFTVVGRGTALTSTNGTTWLDYSSVISNLEDWASSTIPNSVHWIDNRFIICGPIGLLATSP